MTHPIVHGVPSGTRGTFRIRMGRDSGSGPEPANEMSAPPPRAKHLTIEGKKLKI